MKNKTVGILQSNYIPWKGYFDIIDSCDEFYFLDEAQSTKNDWRNRNQIKTSQGPRWLTIPVRHSTSLRICEVEIADRRWPQKHLRSILQAYAKAPCRGELENTLNDIYNRLQSFSFLSEVNRHLIDEVCTHLEIHTPRRLASTVLPIDQMDALSSTERLVELCSCVGATHYLSGPSAKSYLKQELFEAANIQIEWMSYTGYPEYDQLHGKFLHNVSIIDLLLMKGRSAKHYFKTHQETPRFNV